MPSTWLMTALMIYKYCALMISIKLTQFVKKLHKKKEKMYLPILIVLSILLKLTKTAGHAFVSLQNNNPNVMYI